MTKTRQTADHVAWERLHRVTMSLLPVRSPVDLLHALSRTWKEFTGVHELFVSALSPDGNQLWGSLNDADEVDSFIRSDLDGGEWNESVAVAALRDQAGSSRIERDLSVKVFPFSSPNENLGELSNPHLIIGGVVLFDKTPDEVEVEVPLLEELADLSGQLIQQRFMPMRETIHADEIHNESRVSNDTPGSGCIMIDSAKLEALAEFSAGAGHEINNPLATINGRVQLLLQNEIDPQRRQSLLTIGGQAYRIRDMIGDAMLFGRPPEPEIEPLDLSEIISSVVGKLSGEINQDEVVLEIATPIPVPCRADPAQLSVVISSLIQNSLNALVSRGGKIHVSAETVIEEEARFALLTVSDDGPGFQREERAHLFDPFYSARQAGRGLGFGLPKCWQIVSNHGGRIEVNSVPEGKTTFYVFWPAGRDDGETVAD